MYIEEPKRKINWGSVIKKGLIIILIAAIIFLIIWLFTRNNSNAVNVEYENNNNNNGNVNEVLPNPNSYSETFINNFRYFHDTAKEYFLISELPQDGKTLNYTLQDLIDKNLILPFSYNESTCNYEQSNAIVQNNNGKHTMTITLVCGDEIAQTIEELGCNQLCENNSCTEELQYQYKQQYEVTQTTYSCPSGYAKTGSGSKTKCVKNNSSTISAEKVVTTICSNGATPNSNGKCPVTNTTYIEAKTKTYCENGKTPNSDGKCPVSEYVDAKTKTYCENGKTPNSNGKCPVTNTTYVEAKTKYTCDGIGGELVNEKFCRSYYTSSQYVSYTTYKGETYNGCTHSGTYTGTCSSYSGCTRTYHRYYCTKTSYKDVDAKTITYCENGATPNSNGKCPVTHTTYVEAKNKTYCENGATPNSNGKCSTTTYVDAKTKTYCENGATPNNGKCSVINTNSENAIKYTNYICPSGYTKYGSGSSAICTKGNTSTIEPTKSTKKVTKYKYKWSSETSLKGWTRTGETRKVSSK